MKEPDRGYLAVDLGAGSGRLLLGRVGEDELHVEELHRFPNGFTRRDAHLRWDVEALFAEIRAGLRKAHGAADPDSLVSVGVNTWGVDYALLDGRGELIEDPVCYRDDRTRGAMEEVFERIPRREVYRRTGIQMMPINTLYQLHAQVRDGEWPPQARCLLMMGDLFHYLLSGRQAAELTNATTTQLLHAERRSWDERLLAAIRVPAAVLPELVPAGTALGPLRPALREELGLPALRVVATATHDTASAVAGTPLPEGWAYVSSGTWSLVGIETAEPILSDDAMRHNFTNEGGVYGTYRFLKNVMGLWILESCRQKWREEEPLLDYAELDRRLREEPPGPSFLFPEDPRFLNPDDMPAQIRGYLAETGQEDPGDQLGTSKMILESLALRYASVLSSLEEVTGRRIRGLRIVGGGSRNAFLNQASANATGRDVLAGPAEATSLGNLAVQAVLDGRFRDLAAARRHIDLVSPAERFTPQRQDRWRAAFERYAALEAHPP